MILNRDKNGTILEIKAEKNSILLLTFLDKNGRTNKAFKSMNLFELETFIRSKNISIISNSSNFEYRNAGSIQNVDNDVVIGYYDIDIDHHANFKRRFSIRLDELVIE